LKKPNEGLIVQSKTGSLGDFTKSSMTRDAVTKLGVAHHSPNSDTTTCNKKSKKKAKATASEAGSTDRENKAKNEEETGKLDSTIKDSKEIPSITLKAEKAKEHNADPVKQESLDRSGAVWVAEPTSSRASPARPMTTKARTSTKNMPAEVNDPQKLTYNQPTHVTGPRVPQEDSNLGLALQSSAPNDHFHFQHSKSKYFSIHFKETDAARRYSTSRAHISQLFPFHISRRRGRNVTVCSPHACPQAPGTHAARFCFC
jgi:hypothetical protein